MNSDQEELLNFIMGYVDEADKHNVNKVGIEQSIQDIIDDCEELAMEIENGDWENET